MKFEEIDINNIKPAPYNPRIMPTAEMEKLKNNLKTYGLIDPILIDLTDNNTVIGGHQRLEALKEIQPDATLKLLRLGDLGLIFNETKIKIKDKNDQKSMNLSLNKIQGDWDYQKLDEIILEVNNEQYDLTLTGFDTPELINLSEMDFNPQPDNVQTLDKFEEKIGAVIERELDEGVTEWDKQRTQAYEEYNKKEITNIHFEYRKGDEIKLGPHTLIIGDLHEINKNFTLKFNDELIVTCLPQQKLNFLSDNEKR